ncbi:MAG: hypothetical protein ACFCU6_14735 [Balneolaceae bacterium]
MSKLTRNEALKLLLPVVDNEATKRERTLFFTYLETDPELRRQYNSLLFVKKLMKEKYRKEKAPDELKKSIINRIYSDDSVLEDHYVMESPSESTHNKRLSGNSWWEKKKNETKRTSIFRYISAAAAIIFFSILIIEMLDYSTKQETDSIYKLEDFVFHHFENNNGGYIQPTYETASLESAEEFLNENYSLQITAPPVQGAQLTGIVLSEFVPDFITPLFEYHQKEIDQYIYIFAFHIPQLEEALHISRDPNALRENKTQTDFYINEISGKHIVSWKWDNNWYAAVSNHNGYELASIIEPLNFDINK